MSTQDTSREAFEQASARLIPCPLCGNSDVQLNLYRDMKPDANCNNCGICYQDQTIDEVVEHWNVGLRKLNNHARLLSAIKKYLEPQANDAQSEMVEKELMDAIEEARK
jgi:hypothetical protein